MPCTTDHIIDRPWDPPFERVRIAYAYTPGSRPTWDDPGEPETVEPLLCRAMIDGEWEDQSERVLQAMARSLHDDMVAEARDEIAERRSFARAEAREMEDAA